MVQSARFLGGGLIPLRIASQAARLFPSPASIGLLQPFLPVRLRYLHPHNNTTAVVQLLEFTLVCRDMSYLELRCIIPAKTYYFSVKIKYLSVQLEKRNKVF